MNILLIGGCLSNNEGGVAIVRSASQTLSEVLPCIKVQIMSCLPEDDSKRSMLYGIDLIVEKKDKESRIFHMISLLIKIGYCLIWKFVKEKKYFVLPRS